MCVCVCPLEPFDREPAVDVRWTFDFGQFS